MGKGKFSTVYKVRGIKGEIVSRTPVEDSSHPHPKGPSSDGRPCWLCVSGSTLSNIPRFTRTTLSSPPGSYGNPPCSLNSLLIPA